MQKKNKWRLRAIGISTLGMLGAVTTGGTGCSSDDVDQVECVTNRDYFANEVYPVLSERCVACHIEGGEAGETDFILTNPAVAGFLDKNFEATANIARLERDGASQLLLKGGMLNGTAHVGGQLLQRDTPEFQSFANFAVRLKNDEECEAQSTDLFAGVELANAEQTLRLASLSIGDRLPREDEIERVRQGGFVELDIILDEMMTEEPFIEFVKRTFAEPFQTDFYLNNDAVGLLADYYPNATWYDNDASARAMIQQYGLRDADEIARMTQQALAREPLELVAHVARNDLPFTEIVTADYFMVSPLSARTYGVEAEFQRGNDPMEFAPAYLDYEDQAYPHAGVLTSPIFLNRWPSTPTNRNRARARVAFLFFLGTDILSITSARVDDGETTANPTRDDAQCVICHAKLDPVAGTFQAFSDDGQFIAEPEWFAEMFPPGFGGLDMPPSQAANGLPWLAANIARDERFLSATVYHIYKGLMGREHLSAPTDRNDPEFDAKFKAFVDQSNQFRIYTERFKAANYNVKQVVKDIIMSPYYRALNAYNVGDERLAAMRELGLGRLLTPEMLDARLQAVFGIPWGDFDGDTGNRTIDNFLTGSVRDLGDVGRYELFYGGLDFNDVTERITNPNGLMAAVAERTATEMSCASVPYDLSLPGEERRLFKPVTLEGVEYDPRNLVPLNGGLEVPQAIAGIKQTIVRLHYQVLGETLTVDSPEVERTYQLFLNTWREINTKMESEEIGENLPFACQVERSPITNQVLPEDQRVQDDENGTIRAWMAVGTYMLSDQKFLFQ